MSKSIAFLQRTSNGKMVFILFILTNLVYGTILGYSIPLVLSFAPKSILFDMSPMGYSYAQAVELLQALGLEGRAAYLFVQIPIDFVYPALFAVSYALLITWVLKKGLSSDSKLFLFAFVPVIAGVFDYLENLSIIVMLKSFPDTSESLVSISSFFTMAKSAFTTLFFVILIVALAFSALWRLKKDKRATGSQG